MAIDWNLPLQVQIKKDWVEATVCTRTPTQVSVTYGDRQLATVAMSKIRNTPCKKTAGMVYRTISKNAFQEQLTDEATVNRLVDALEEEGFIKRL